MKDISIRHTHPEIVKDWDFKSNEKLDPTNFVKTSKQSVWWMCEKEHKYKVSIYSRIRSKGCKICNTPFKAENIRKSKVSKGKSFAEAKPELLLEWNFEKNNLKPEDISEKSHISVWFKCKNKHEWQSTPQRRSRGDGCPICYQSMRGEIVRKGKLKKTGITLFQKFPELIKEWDYEKNTIEPTELSPKSNFKAFWKCKFGHNWQATVVNRTHAESNCPFCTNQTSKLEIFIYCECLQLFENVKWRSKIDGFECDILLENEKIAIEIDGGYWHRNKLEKDIIKTNALKAKGIELIRVRDSSLPLIEGNVIKFNKSDEYIDITISALSLISELIGLDLNKYKSQRLQLGEVEYQKILSFLPSPPENESLLFKYPTVSEEWDYKINYPLKPEMFSVGSEQKVFWKCNKGHSWTASIKNRSLKKSRCPICSQLGQGERVRKALLKKSGISLASSFPNFLTEWDYEKNNLLPFDVAPKTNLKAWWICVNGHSYNQSIAGKTRGDGCPFCSSQKRSKSARDVRIIKTGTLDKVFPEIAKQWDFEKNITQPSDFPPGSKEKAWWLCSNGHSWVTNICNRTNQKQGCPICFKQNQKTNSLRLAVKRHGSLNELNPPFLLEWDYTKNTDIKPTDLTLNNKTKVWWLCSNQHSYSQSPNDRNHGHGCPLCSKQKKIDSYKLKILETRGSLKDNNPELLIYWDSKKNMPITPDKLTAGSHETVWWKCLKGHSWQEPINKMTNKKRKNICVICKT
jgi:very-short-patch-repair endonuclease